MADTQQKPEEIIESLQAQLDTERAEHGATKQNLANALGELTDKEQALAEKDQALAEATSIIDGKSATIQEQEAKILSLQTSPAEFPSFKLKGTEYEVRTKSFKYQGKEYTAKDLLTNASLQAELIKKGVGFIVAKQA